MNIIQEIDRLYLYVREGELCSYPILDKKSEKVELEIFTYFASEEDDSQTVYGFGQLIKTDGTNIFVSEMDLFQREEDLITFEVPPFVTEEARNELYEYYCDCLQKYYDEPSDENKRLLRDAFTTVVPLDAVILYKVVSPWFINMLGL